jgi:multidrug resistance efflux pump
MLELLLCSMLTILPDYLYRRYAQGRRIGKQITLYSVWYELRWGITACLMLTISLITVVFYNHPSTTNVTSYFRTIPILSEGSGRVAQVYVGVSSELKKGDPILRLDSSKQEAALESARRQITEVDASMLVAKSDLAAAEGQIQQAQSSLQQAIDELQTKEELNRRNADIVARREIEKLQNVVDGRRGALEAAVAAREGTKSRISTLLPAQKATAEAARDEAQVELGKMIIYAGVDGRVEQFVVQVGDIINPIMRPAGVLIPSELGRGRLQAGFGQIEAQIMKIGMIAEVTCVSKPFTIIPMVVTGVQDFIATGQFRAADQLVDINQQKAPGSILVFMEPLYKGGTEDVPPGSSCIANAYSNNHEALQSKDIGTGRWLYLHVVDAVALVHAMILRIQALLLPIQVLVFGGH